MTEKDNKETEKKHREEEWIIKPCDWYHNEYKDCKCLRARFNQWFIYGEFLNCKQWKIDYQNCQKWQLLGNEEAYEELLASEKEHRLQRLRGHYGNDVWTKRDKPPESWNAPLPEWLQKKQEGTFLAAKQKALETGNINDIDMKLPLCTIL